MTRSAGRPRPAFSLLELLVVMGIIGVAIGLALPAIQKAREAAARSACSNNLRQVGLAFHAADAANGRMPPGIGSYPSSSSGSPSGTAYFHVLPYLEQQALYDEAHVGGTWAASNNGVYARPLQALRCPSDPTAGDGVAQDNFGNDWGGAAYAGNAQVFCQVYPDGRFKDPYGNPSLSTAFFRDGTSKTILFAEKYVRCRNFDFPEGGSFWAYWITGYAVQPLHPAFAISWTPNSYGPNSLFQVRPPPDNCDPTRASTAHPSGIMVLMADGGVRAVSPRISGDVWWAACTPAGGEAVGLD
jgi:prepilin-type N-terminal cleavage/methylation domain-containing protein